MTLKGTDMSRIIYINIGLALLCLYLSVETIQVWRNSPIESIQKESVGKQRPVGAANPASSDLINRMPPKSMFQDTATLNLFSMDRQEYKPTTTETDTGGESEPAEQTPLFEGREITLFGVILLDGYRAALISDPETKKDKKSTRWVKPNDIIGTMKVDTITADSLILADKGQKFRVELYDKDKRKNRTKPPGDKPIQPTQADKPVQPTVVTTQPASTRKPDAEPNPKIAEDSKNQQPATDDYVIINTPFGKIKRKKQ
jgi:hypothetical protein